MLVAIGFGTGWIFIVLGLLIRTPTTVMTLGFTFLFPVVFASNIMVDPATMPGWLRAFVDVNPVSLMTTALRGLMSGGATFGAGGPGADRAGRADRHPGAGHALDLSQARLISAREPGASVADVAAGPIGIRTSPPFARRRGFWRRSSLPKGRYRHGRQGDGAGWPIPP